MAAVLADVTIDDVEVTLCSSCADAYAVRDGWQGYCPACCALVDDHDTGRHERLPVVECRVCDDEVEARLDLFAIA